MDSAQTDSISPDPCDAAPGELLASIRWTQQLAGRLVHDPVLAADVQQELWTRALERFGSALPGRAWLAGTMRSMAFRARRSTRRRRLHESRAARQEDAVSVEELAMRGEAQQRIAAAVQTLPDASRIALLLHFQEGLSFAAVAKHIGCSKSAAAERVQRALDALRRELKRSDKGWSACCLLAVPFGGSTAGLPIDAPSMPSTLAAASASNITSTSLVSLTMKKIAVAAVLLLAGFAAWASTDLGSRPVDRTQANAVTAAELASDRGVAPVRESPQRLDEAAAGRSPVDLAPTPAAPVYILTARVWNSDGQPAKDPRIEVLVPGVRREATGNTAGQVELRLDAKDLDLLGRYEVSIQVSAGPHQTLWSTYISRNGTSPIPRPMLGIVEDLGEIHLEPAGALHGRATDRFQEPIVGAEISAYDVDPGQPDLRLPYDGSIPDVVTDEDGRFMVGHFGRERVALSVRHPDYLARSPLTKCDVTLGLTTGPVYVVGAEAEIVTGRVVDSKGKPVAGAAVNGTDNWSIYDTDDTDSEGRFRIGLREGSPAAVQVYHPGWRQVDPPSDTLQTGGELEIRIERILPEAKFSVLVVDAETQETLRYAGVLIQAGGARTPVDGDAAPAMVRQPSDGIPADFAKDSARLVVAGEGYQTRAVSAADLTPEGKLYTVALNPTPGVSGQLVRNGQPVAGAHVQLAGVWAHAAKPLEVLRSGVPRRLETEPLDPEALTGKRSNASEPILGLGIEPPPYRLVASNNEQGQRTDASGRFHFHGVKLQHACLRVKTGGAPTRILTGYRIENGTLDIGVVELEAASTLTGRIESTWPWSPEEHKVVLSDLHRSVPLDADGVFRLDGLQPGSVYFTVRGAGEHDMDFEDVPVFHASLAPGETRSVSVSLDPYAPSSLDLNITIGGKPPTNSRLLYLAPVAQPERTFRLWCLMDGHHLTAPTSALGPCTVTLLQHGPNSGRVRLMLPGGPFDLRAGEAATRKVDVPAGWIQLSIPAGHAARQYGEVDLVLTANHSEFEVISIKLPASNAEDAPAAVTLVPGPIPPGTYRASLRPGRWRNADDASRLLAEFDVTVAASQTTELALE